jgi:hypothetical protein
VTVEALLAANATAYEICAYLVLANHTDPTGRYSTASTSAINRRTGANKVKDGPIAKALQRLQSIHAVRRAVSDRANDKNYLGSKCDLGPILRTRETWVAAGGERLPDGPSARSKVLYILPDFDEPLQDRVWFGSRLVTGAGDFACPLKALKNAGDAAAQLLLSIYAANDMEIWGGARPVGVGRGPWKRYMPVDADAIQLAGGAKMIRAKEIGEVANIPKGAQDVDYWAALKALQSAGFVYEVVVVLNRNAVKAKFRDGEEYGDIPDDAEPYYELDCRSLHGYKPQGEEGLAGATARTAGELGFSVIGAGRDREEKWGGDSSYVPADEGARFDGTYAAIVPAGFPAMIAGIFRLRFRVANPKNAGIKAAWARIAQNNREAFALIERVRAANRLAPVKAPWDVAEAAKSGAKERRVECQLLGGADGAAVAA